MKVGYSNELVKRYETLRACRVEHRPDWRQEAALLRQEGMAAWMTAASALPPVTAVTLPVAPCSALAASADGSDALVSVLASMTLSVLQEAQA
jgi:hypothetical protein